MDKVSKQRYIAAIQAVFSSVSSSKDISSYKLWPYIVGVSCGLNKRLVVDPQYKDRPIVSLYNFSGWSGEDEYSKQGGWYNSAIADLIDLANEVSPFNLDNVYDICRQVWACRQAMVYPAALANSSKEKTDAAANALLCSMPINVKTFEVLTEKENQEVIIHSNRLSSIIEKMIQDYIEQAPTQEQSS